jgi:hypothetical protein
MIDHFLAIGRKGLMQERRMSSGSTSREERGMIYMFLEHFNNFELDDFFCVHQRRIR